VGEFVVAEVAHLDVEAQGEVGDAREGEGREGREEDVGLFLSVLDELDAEHAEDDEGVEHG